MADPPGASAHQDRGRYFTTPVSGGPCGGRGHVVLRDTGNQMLVLGPIPDPQSDPPTCLSGQLYDVTACSPPRSSAVDESGVHAQAAATNAGGGQYADLTDFSAPPNGIRSSSATSWSTSIGVI
jgi:hypothetical protein